MNTTVSSIRNTVIVALMIALLGTALGMLLTSGHARAATVKPSAPAVLTAKTVSQAPTTATVQPWPGPLGDLSGIAQANGLSLATVEADNPQITNPNLVTVGQVVNLTPGHASPAATDGDGDNDGDLSDAPASTVTPSATPQAPVQQGQAPAAQPVQQAPVTQAPQQSSNVTAPGGISIPGMPQSLANCIWMRESTNGTNPAANGNQFGIIPASGYNVAGQSVAQQEATAGQIYASAGGQAWAADGCPGT